MYLSTLQVTNLHSHLLDRRCDASEGCHVVSVAVTLDDLSRDVCALDAELLAYIVLDEWRDVCEVTHSARNLTYLYAACCSNEASEVTLHLLVPQRPLKAEASDVGVDAVCTADAGSALKLDSALAQHLEHLLDILQEDRVSLLQKVAVGRIHNIGAGEAIVYPLTLLAEGLAHGACEGYDVVACLLLNLIDAVDVERCALPELLNILLGHYAQLAPSL